MWYMSKIIGLALVALGIGIFITLCFPLSCVIVILGILIIAVGLCLIC